MTRALLVVYPTAKSWDDRRGRGLRHYAIAGEPRTLCGRPCDWWNLDPTGEPRVGCKRCLAAEIRGGR